MGIEANLGRTHDIVRGSGEARNTTLAPRDFGVKSIASITEKIQGLNSLGMPEGILKKVEGITGDLLRKTEKLIEGLKIDKQKIDKIVTPVLGVILGFLSEASIPDDVKDRYLQVVREAIDDLSGVTPDQINSVQKRQSEIAGPFASTDPAYYLGEILKSRVLGQLGFSESVGRSFREERIKAPDGSEYQKENLGKYILYVQSLDKRLGIRLYETIILPLLGGRPERLPPYVLSNMRATGNLSTTNLSSLIGVALVEELHQKSSLPARQVLLNLLKSGTLSESSLRNDDPHRYTNVGDMRVDIVGLLLGQGEVSRYFQAYEREAQMLRWTAKGGKDGLLSSTPTFEGGKLITGNIGESMKNMDVQQIIILLSQLIPILPSIGSIAGAVDSSRNIANGISLTGENINIPLEGLSVLADTLDTMTLGVSQFGKLIKAKKIVELIAKMKAIFSHLPTVIDRALAAEQMTAEKRVIIGKLRSVISAIGPALERLGIDTKSMGQSLTKYSSGPSVPREQALGRGSIKEAKKPSVNKSRDLPPAQELNKEIENAAEARGVDEKVIRKEYLMTREGLSEKQAERVIRAHSEVSGVLGDYTPGELKKKIRIMTEPGEGKLSQEKARSILQKGYAGKMDRPDSNLGMSYEEAARQFNLGTIDTENFENKKPGVGIIQAIAEHYKKDSVESLKEYLDDMKIKYDGGDIETTISRLREKKYTELIGKAAKLMASDIPVVVDAGNAKVAGAFIKGGKSEEVGEFLKRLGDANNTDEIRELVRGEHGKDVLDAILGRDAADLKYFIGSFLRALTSDDRVVHAIQNDSQGKVKKILEKYKGFMDSSIYDNFLNSFNDIIQGKSLKIENLSGIKPGVIIIEAIAEKYGRDTTESLGKYLDSMNIQYDPGDIEKAISSLREKKYTDLIGKAATLTASQLPPVVDAGSARVAGAFIKSGNIIEVGAFLERLGRANNPDEIKELVRGEHGKDVLDAILGRDVADLKYAIGSFLQILATDYHVIDKLDGDSKNKILSLITKYKSCWTEAAYDNYLAIFKLAKDPSNLGNILKKFLISDSTDESIKSALRDRTSSLHDVWNLEFGNQIQAGDNGRNSVFQMLRRGEPSFFYDMSLSNYFYMEFRQVETEKRYQFLRDEVFQSSGKYHEYVTSRPKLAEYLKSLDSRL